MIEILRRHSFSTAFLAILFIFVFLPAGEDELLQLSGFTMGTTYRLQMVELPRNVTQDELAAGVTNLMNELDRGIFSTYAPDSELSRLNRHSVNLPFIASAHLLTVLQMAHDIAELTDGAFDVTVGPLVNLWGFGPDINTELSAPAAAEIERAREQVGYRYIHIDPDLSEITKQRDVYIDLSGIAKGYAVDQLAAYFDEMGIESYFLEVGGELRIKGTKQGEVSWVPAIEAPLDTESRVYEIFYNRGETIGVAGSGDYRNYFEEDGVRYSHEIDPRTGRPIQHNLAAVYVIDSTTARADALATALMVMGFEAGQELAVRERLAVFFIYKTGDSGFADFATERFSSYLTASE